MAKYNGTSGPALLLRDDVLLAPRIVGRFLGLRFAREVRRAFRTLSTAELVTRTLGGLGRARRNPPLGCQVNLLSSVIIDVLLPAARGRRASLFSFLLWGGEHCFASGGITVPTTSGNLLLTHVLSLIGGFATLKKNENECAAAPVRAG